MKSSADLRAQFRESTSPTTRKVILAQIQVALKREKAEEADLRSQITDCRSCGLGRQRTNAVPWSGPPRGRADLMLVGEAPGAAEDGKGIPFVGPSGKLLDLCLKRAGTSRDKCFVANTLCCRPPKNRDPKPNELAACRPNFDAQIDLADAPVGVTLGAYALASLLNEPRESVSMTTYLNKPVWIAGRIWVPAYHPAYILRNRSMQPVLVESLRFALALRWGRTVLPTPPWEQIQVEGTPGKNIGPHLEKKGYALIFSKTLNTQIVILKDESSTSHRGLIHLPHYTVDELVYVGLLGEGRRRGWTKNALRTLNMVKHEFDGVVVQG